MNRSLRLGTCSHVACVFWLAATTGCGGGDSGGPAANDGSMLGRVPANHRASDIQCAQPAPAGTCSCNGNCPSATYSSEWQCTSDRDCADGGTNGRCTNNLGPAGCWCSYDTCIADSDCPSGQTCACHGAAYTFGSGNGCVPGNCRVDADCGMYGYCSPTPALPCSMVGWPFCQGVGYYCHTSEDQCIDDGDCGGPGCLYDPSVGYWKCHSYAMPL
jgi:hypothetical protein